MPTLAEVDAIAPDAAAIASAKAIAAPRKWLRIGRDDGAAWGEFQGSALYQVRLDVRALTGKCTCPSRKLPCKHTLALAYLVAMESAPVAEAPGWIIDWLKQREAKATRPAAPVSAETSDKRLQSVGGGVTLLWRWLLDRARQGFADLDSTEIDTQAARLVDQKAGGLAGRLRRMAELEDEGRLREAGRLALLCEAFERRDALSPGLRSDLLATLGIAVPRDQVLTVGEAAPGRWHHVGRVTEELDDLLAARDLFVRDDGRTARVLQYAPPGRPIPEGFWPGQVVEATLAFYPSPAPDRALVLGRAPTSAPAAPPALLSVNALLDRHVDTLAAVPWRDRSAAVVGGLRVDPADGMWLVDGEGAALPLRRPDWTLVAAATRGPLTLALEWDGERADVLGVAGPAGWRVG